MLIKIFQDYELPVFITEADFLLDQVSGTEEERYLFQANGFKILVDACLESEVCVGISLFGAFPDSNSWYEKALNKPLADATPWADNKNPKPVYFAILQAFYQHILKLEFRQT